MKQTVVSNEEVRREVVGGRRRHVVGSGSDGDLDVTRVRHIHRPDALRPATDVSLATRRHFTHDSQPTAERRRTGNTAVYDVTVV